MLEETTVATAPETQNEAPEVVETQEVTTPETPAAEEAEQAQEQQAKTPEQREIERLRRALTKRDRTQGKLYQELEQLRRVIPQQQPEQTEQQALTPETVLQIAERIADQKRQVESITQQVSAVLKQGKAIEGFDEACNRVNEEIPFYENGRPTPFLDAVMDSESPAKLLAYLGQNTELAAELAELRPAQIGRRIERIEAQMKARPATSAAPKPLQPLSARASARPVETRMSDEDLVRAIRSSKSR